MTESVDLGRLAREELDSHRDQPFSIDAGEAGTIELALIETADLDERFGSSKERKPFSALFLGPPELILAQQVHLLEHAKMGRLELFLVPLGPDADGKGIRYEAVFT